MQLLIETDIGTFLRTAWTGGDSPYPEFERTTVGRQLRLFFINDQIADCGGPQGVLNWLFADQTLEDKLAIFHQRAIMDAWATYRNGIV